MGLWHYTIARYLPEIISSGRIKFARAGLSSLPAVWFSTNPLWEETANKMFRDEKGLLHILNLLIAMGSGFRMGTKETTHIIGGGLARIEVRPEVAPYTWEHYRRKSKQGSDYLQALEIQGNPEEWRISYEPVFRKDWLSIEVWDSISGIWAPHMKPSEPRQSFIGEKAYIGCRG